MPCTSKNIDQSVWHSFAKLITKILANRLAGHLDQMVSTSQSAFIKGRLIQDNFMLVQQMARYLHQQKQARILLKVDITKAFDSVSWPFLLEVLRNLGFGQIWCDIISGLLTSSSTQVIVNGIPGDKVTLCRPCYSFWSWTCCTTWSKSRRRGSASTAC